MRRAQDLTPPIQMCDALSRNLPQELETIVANCLAHGRRQFVDVIEQFPDECRYVLETLQVVYRNDAIARERNLSPQARLQFHQDGSGPPMDQLKAWLARQFDERLVEPNSSLGGAIRYLQRHWEKLTLFLRVPGAPLDNNTAERALKKAILHRRNSLLSDGKRRPLSPEATSPPVRRTEKSFATSPAGHRWTTSAARLPTACGTNCGRTWRPIISFDR